MVCGRHKKRYVKYSSINYDEVVKSQKSDGTVKSFRCKARKSEGMRRTCLYAAMTEDAAERRRWTFYEAVNYRKESLIMNNKIDKKALWDLSYGMYIVSSGFNGKQNGQVANTVFQITAEPPRIAVCINKGNLTHEYISKSGLFTVSVLDESTPMTFIGLFGFKCGRDIDKLSQCFQVKTGSTGCPIVMDYALSVIEARVFNQIDAGTHTVFLGDVVSAEVLREGRPLTYAYYQEVKKGKAPKNAPTYRSHAGEEK